MRFVFSFLLFCSVSYADTMLIKTQNEDQEVLYFWCEIVNGIPGDWNPIETAFDEFVDMTNGETPPTVDLIAIEVDKYADVPNDPATRTIFANTWNEAIVCFERNECDLQQSQDMIKEKNNETLNSLTQSLRSKWVVFLDKVAVLSTKERSEGKYSINTLRSIHKGLMYE